MDEHNHALAALRYLVSRLDARHMARGRRPHQGGDEPPPAPEPPTRPRPWLRLDNEDLWTTFR
ncbi:MAG: hypothetical protein JO244_07830 [Solirubrobacterales bacterium]|nr:hypothetical protein [Solirubrobacterales bacterium]